MITFRPIPARQEAEPFEHYKERRKWENQAVDNYLQGQLAADIRPRVRTKGKAKKKAEKRAKVKRLKLIGRFQLPHGSRPI